MLLRPRPGLLIRDPAAPAVPLPPEGREVPPTTYWTRRLRRGDVELIRDTEALRALERTAPQPADPEVLP